MIVYLNGNFLPPGEARISPDDRGFLFADGAYEVIRAYPGGRLFRAEDHFVRLARSLRELRLTGPASADLERVCRDLLARNDLVAADAKVYLQITRGTAPRTHTFPPPNTAPTVYAAASPVASPRQDQERGVGVILVPDVRWSRCDIKSVALVANVLAAQQAKEQNAMEAVFVRDGVVTEGSHTNVGAVFGGELWTAPESSFILSGITRKVVLELASALGIPVRQTAIPVARFCTADEAMVLGTTTEVMPVVRVDGRPVGQGAPGPVTRRLLEAFQRLVASIGERA